MKTIKYLIMGSESVGKSVLLNSYLWKLQYGRAYHDDSVEQQHYLIDAIEIETIGELQEHLVDSYVTKNIYFVCFNVNDKKTLQAARDSWMLELLKFDPKTKIFLVGLQCDLRENILRKLTQNYVSHEDGVNISRYYENVQYMECSVKKVDSVRSLFDKAFEIAMYEEEGTKSQQILKFYDEISINFQFKNCNCEGECSEDDCDMD